ncbi:MAG TPA: hypothetical protein VKU82_00100 [Planctomycetaceae bacterium]|nr:hypothetical protein [Planctomycetaceae bacterium]
MPTPRWRAAVKPSWPIGDPLPEVKRLPFWGSHRDNRLHNAVGTSQNPQTRGGAAV